MTRFANHSLSLLYSAIYLACGVCSSVAINGKLLNDEVDIVFTVHNFVFWSSNLNPQNTIKRLTS